MLVGKNGETQVITHVILQLFVSAPPSRQEAKFAIHASRIHTEKELLTLMEISPHELRRHASRWKKLTCLGHWR